MGRLVMGNKKFDWDGLNVFIIHKFISMCKGKCFTQTFYPLISFSQEHCDQFSSRKVPPNTEVFLCRL